MGLPVRPGSGASLGLSLIHILLSPAGDMERLRMSLAYGADAVYLAGPDFGMRSFAGNFTPEEPWGPPLWPSKSHRPPVPRRAA